MIVAARAGIPVFATGGIGGVHRGAEQSFDISADLTELARTGVTVVAAGAKALLDLPKTLEMLETLGVPVVCYRTDQFPAFWSRTSGLKAPIRLDDAAAIAAFIRAREALALGGGMLVANPVPEADEIPAGEMEAHIDGRLCATASPPGITGKAVTPYLLDADPEAHRRPEPRHQHRADQEQCAPRGGDRGGAGKGIGPAENSAAALSVQPKFRIIAATVDGIRIERIGGEVRQAEHGRLRCRLRGSRGRR